MKSFLKRTKSALGVGSNKSDKKDSTTDVVKVPSNYKFDETNVPSYIELLESTVKQKTGDVLKNGIQILADKSVTNVIDSYFNQSVNKDNLPNYNANITWSALMKILEMTNPILSDSNCVSLQHASGKDVSNITNQIPLHNQQVLGALFASCEIMIRDDPLCGKVLTTSLSDALMWSLPSGTTDVRESFCNLIANHRQNLPFSFTFSRRISSKRGEEIDAVVWLQIINNNDASGVVRTSSADIEEVDEHGNPIPPSDDKARSQPASGGGSGGGGKGDEQYTVKAAAVLVRGNIDSTNSHSNINSATATAENTASATESNFRSALYKPDPSTFMRESLKLNAVGDLASANDHSEFDVLNVSNLSNKSDISTGSGGGVIGSGKSGRVKTKGSILNARANLKSTTSGTGPDTDSSRNNNNTASGGSWTNASSSSNKAADQNSTSSAAAARDSLDKGGVFQRHAPRRSSSYQSDDDDYDGNSEADSDHEFDHSGNNKTSNHSNRNKHTKPSSDVNDSNDFDSSLTFTNTNDSTALRTAILDETINNDNNNGEDDNNNSDSDSSQHSQVLSLRDLQEVFASSLVSSVSLEYLSLAAIKDSDDDFADIKGLSRNVKWTLQNEELADTVLNLSKKPEHKKGIVSWHDFLALSTGRLEKTDRAYVSAHGAELLYDTPYKRVETLKPSATAAPKKSIGTSSGASSGGSGASGGNAAAEHKGSPSGASTWASSSNNSNSNNSSNRRESKQQRQQDSSFDRRFNNSDNESDSDESLDEIPMLGNDTKSKNKGSGAIKADTKAATRGGAAESKQQSQHSQGNDISERFDSDSSDGSDDFGREASRLKKSFDMGKSSTSTAGGSNSSGTERNINRDAKTSSTSINRHSSRHHFDSDSDGSGNESGILSIPELKSGDNSPVKGDGRPKTSGYGGDRPVSAHGRALPDAAGGGGGWNNGKNSTKTKSSMCSSHDADDDGDDGEDEHTGKFSTFNRPQSRPQDAVNTTTVSANSWDEDDDGYGGVDDSRDQSRSSLVFMDGGEAVGQQQQQQTSSQQGLNHSVNDESFSSDRVEVLSESDGSDASGDEFDYGDSGNRQQRKAKSSRNENRQQAAPDATAAFVSRTAQSESKPSATTAVVTAATTKQTQPKPKKSSGGMFSLTAVDRSLESNDTGSGDGEDDETSLQTNDNDNESDNGDLNGPESKSLLVDGGKTFTATVPSAATTATANTSATAAVSPTRTMQQRLQAAGTSNSLTANDVSSRAVSINDENERGSIASTHETQSNAGSVADSTGTKKPKGMFSKLKSAFGGGGGSKKGDKDKEKDQSLGQPMAPVVAAATAVPPRDSHLPTIPRQNSQISVQSTVSGGSEAPSTASQSKAKKLKMKSILNAMHLRTPGSSSATPATASTLTTSNVGALPQASAADALSQQQQPRPSAAHAPVGAVALPGLHDISTADNKVDQRGGVFGGARQNSAASVTSEQSETPSTASQSKAKKLKMKSILNAMHLRTPGSSTATPPADSATAGGDVGGNNTPTAPNASALSQAPVGGVALPGLGGTTTNRNVTSGHDTQQSADGSAATAAAAVDSHQERAESVTSEQSETPSTASQIKAKKLKMKSILNAMHLRRPSSSRDLPAAVNNNETGVTAQQTTADHNQDAAMQNSGVSPPSSPPRNEHKQQSGDSSTRKSSDRSARDSQQPISPMVSEPPPSQRQTSSSTKSTAEGPAQRHQQQQNQIQLSSQRVSIPRQDSTTSVGSEVSQSQSQSQSDTASVSSATPKVKKFKMKSLLNAMHLRKASSNDSIVDTPAGAPPSSSGGGVAASGLTPEASSNLGGHSLSATSADSADSAIDGSGNSSGKGHRRQHSWESGDGSVEESAVDSPPQQQQQSQSQKRASGSAIDGAGANSGRLRSDSSASDLQSVCSTDSQGKKKKLKLKSIMNALHLRTPSEQQQQQTDGSHSCAGIAADPNAARPLPSVPSTPTTQLNAPPATPQAVSVEKSGKSLSKRLSNPALLAKKAHSGTGGSFSMSDLARSFTGSGRSSRSNSLTGEGEGAQPVVDAAAVDEGTAVPTTVVKHAPSGAPPASLTASSAAVTASSTTRPPASALSRSSQRPLQAPPPVLVRAASMSAATLSPPPAALTPTPRDLTSSSAAGLRISASRNNSNSSIVFNPRTVVSIPTNGRGLAALLRGPPVNNGLSAQSSPTPRNRSPSKRATGSGPGSGSPMRASRETLTVVNKLHRALQRSMSATNLHEELHHRKQSYGDLNQHLLLSQPHSQSQAHHTDHSQGEGTENVRKDNNKNTLLSEMQRLNIRRHEKIKEREAKKQQKLLASSAASPGKTDSESGGDNEVKGNGGDSDSDSDGDSDEEDSEAAKYRLINSWHNIVDRREPQSMFLTTHNLSDLKALVDKHTAELEARREGKKVVISHTIDVLSPRLVNANFGRELFSGFSAQSAALGVPLSAPKPTGGGSGGTGGAGGGGAESVTIHSLPQRPVYSDLDSALGVRLSGTLQKKSATGSGFRRRYYVLVVEPTVNPNLGLDAAAATAAPTAEGDSTLVDAVPSETTTPIACSGKGSGGGGSGSVDGVQDTAASVSQKSTHHQQQPQPQQYGYYLQEYRRSVPSLWGTVPVAYNKAHKVHRLVSIVTASQAGKQGREFALTFKLDNSIGGNGSGSDGPSVKEDGDVAKGGVVAGDGLFDGDEVSVGGDQWNEDDDDGEAEEDDEEEEDDKDRWSSATISVDGSEADQGESGHKTGKRMLPKRQESVRSVKSGSGIGVAETANPPSAVAPTADGAEASQPVAEGGASAVVPPPPATATVTVTVTKNKDKTTYRLTLRAATSDERLQWVTVLQSVARKDIFVNTISY